MNIRKAKKQDVLRIAEIQVHGWRTAYVNLMPQTTLAQLSIEDKTTMWLKIIETNQTHILVYDAPIKGIVGWVAYGPARDPHQDKTVAEISAIYIDPVQIRSGYGKQLFKQSVINLKEMGYLKVYLWVLSENHNAILFYKNQGMLKDEMSEKEFVIDHTTLPEQMYYLDI